MFIIAVACRPSNGMARNCPAPIPTERRHRRLLRRLPCRPESSPVPISGRAFRPSIVRKGTRTRAWVPLRLCTRSNGGTSRGGTDRSITTGRRKPRRIWSTNRRRCIRRSFAIYPRALRPLWMSMLITGSRRLLVPLLGPTIIGKLRYIRSFKIIYYK